ncbi:MAG: permease-like cell division protein FtsX [Oscillospiraceae bacterium]|nr:permease-like cell division protein FtsX [Oscillospiraceae bacterium]
MTFSSFRYLVKQGWHNMIANRLMSFASFGVLTACLVITGAALLLSVNLNSYMTYLGSQTAVEAFLEDTVDSPARDALEASIKAMPEQSEYLYVSKEQAVIDLGNEMEDMKPVLEEYAGPNNPGNPLPASFRVFAKDPQDVPALSKKLAALPGVYKVKTPTELATVLANMKTIVNFAGWGIIASLAVVSVVVISNTIRLTVFARRKEINIMKFVGATNGFIRLPFFVEGVTVGVVAGAVSSMIVLGTYSAILRYLTTPDAAWLSFFTQSILPVTAVWPMIVASFIVFGVFIGSIGTTSSIRKHLKV